jgi:hypothetical protein
MRARGVLLAEHDVRRSQEHRAQRVRFDHADRTLRLTPRPDPERAPLWLDRHAARRLLAESMRDATRVRTLRSFLATCGRAVSRMTDVEVIEDLAARIAMRRVYVYAEVIERVTHGVFEEAKEEALGPLSVQGIEEEADERIDVAAQVAAMCEAAEKARPFCEECEKAKQVAAVGAVTATDSYAETDVEKQAAAMRQAAAVGLPLCEECERARRAA